MRPPRSSAVKTAFQKFGSGMASRAPRLAPRVLRRETPLRAPRSAPGLQSPRELGALRWSEVTKVEESMRHTRQYYLALPAIGRTVFVEAGRELTRLPAMRRAPDRATFRISARGGRSASSRSLSVGPSSMPNF